MAARSGSGYRWLILLTLVVGTAMINYANMIFSSRPVDMMAQYAMNQAQLTAITTIGMLPGALFSIILGNFFDKRGQKTMRFVGALLLFLAAAFMLWRVYANSYVQLVIITFMAGTLFLPTQVLPFKMIGAWFNRNQMGVGMGIYGAAAGLGIMLAFALGGVFPDTTSALMSCAIGYAAAAVLWIVFVSMPSDMPQAVSAEDAQAASAVNTGAVLRSKNMWLVMICSFVACSVPLLFNSYVVNAFLDKGMEPALTSLLGVVFNISLVVGAISAGSVAGKVGRYNGVYIVCCVVGGLFILLTYLVPMGPLTFVCLALGGIFSAGSLSLNLTRVGLLHLTGDFGPENNGIAGGTNNTAMGLGIFILPTVAASILGNNYMGVFITIFVLFVAIGFIGRFLMPELGERGELAQAAAQNS
ncbi:MAG: MFS transporter [Eggerthellaceae bacterium]|nr:MFS transporter [Eggerthellaceae bacterium]